MPPELRVTGTVSIDLRTDDDYTLMRRMQSAADAPPGSVVEFGVEPRSWPDPVGVEYLRANGDHLRRIEVRCSDPFTVRRWVLALRGED